MYCTTKNFQNGGLSFRKTVTGCKNYCIMDYLEEQREEVETLKSIFPEEFSELSIFPPAFMIRIDDVSISPSISSLQLKISFPSKYPDEIPSIEIPNRSNTMPKKFIDELISFLRCSCQQYIGMPMVFGLVDSAKEWINENTGKFNIVPGKDETVVIEHEEEVSDQDSVNLQNVKEKLEMMNVRGGRWDFVVGLIGNLLFLRLN